MILAPKSTMSRFVKKYDGSVAMKKSQETPYILIVLAVLYTYVFLLDALVVWKCIYKLTLCIYVFLLINACLNYIFLGEWNKMHMCILCRTLLSRDAKCDFIDNDFEIGFLSSTCCSA